MTWRNPGVIPQLVGAGTLLQGRSQCHNLKTTYNLVFTVRYELNIKGGQTLRNKCLNPRRLGLEDVTRFSALVSARGEPNCGLFRSCGPYKTRSSHF